MDDVTLAALEHENMVATLSLTAARMDGALVRNSGGVTILATGLPLRLFNQVLVSGSDASVATLRAAITELRQRTEQHVVNLRVGPDDRFLALVEELGLVPISPEPWMPGMAMWPLPAAGSVALPEGHQVRRLTEGARLEDHITAAAEGFGMPRAWLESIMRPELLEDPSIAVYAGYDGGVPVTSGLGVITGRTIGVYNIATVPAARQRGFGAAITMRIVEDGAAAGCDVAILQASDMGKPIYERLGFRTVVEYDGYADPATLGDD